MMESIERLMAIVGENADGIMRYPTIATWLREVEAEIAENFMKLPIGRDGQPIHIGDKLVNDTATRRATVIGVDAREFFFLDDGRIKKNRADCWKHAKPDPLRERAKEFLRDYRGLNLKAPDAKLEAMLDAFCADVRELMEVDE